jgi:hypothetical protein
MTADRFHMLAIATPRSSAMPPAMLAVNVKLLRPREAHVRISCGNAAAKVHSAGAGAVAGSRPSMARALFTMTAMSAPAIGAAT